MASATHVLLYGNDETLLTTRSWILTKSGFLVDRATSADEVERKVAEHRPEVLILCHTLSSEECRRVGQIATQSQLLMRTLVLATRFSGCTPNLPSTLFVVSPDPQRLISTVQDLACGRGPEPKTIFLH